MTRAKTESAIHEQEVHTEQTMCFRYTFGAFLSVTRQKDKPCLIYASTTPPICWLSSNFQSASSLCGNILQPPSADDWQWNLRFCVRQKKDLICQHFLWIILVKWWNPASFKRADLESKGCRQKGLFQNNLKCQKTNMAKFSSCIWKIVVFDQNDISG